MSHVISCPQCKRQIPLDAKAAKVVAGGTQSVQCASCKHTWMPKSNEVKSLDAAKPVPEVPAPKWKYIPQPQPDPEPEHQESENQAPGKVDMNAIKREPWFDDVSMKVWVFSVNRRIRKESPGLHNMIRCLDGSAIAILLVGGVGAFLSADTPRGPSFSVAINAMVGALAIFFLILGFATLLRLIALIEINTRTRNTAEQEPASKDDA